MGLLDERLYQRMEELVDQVRDLSQAVSPTYGGNNLHYEVKRVADSIGSAQYELSRIAAALEEIKKALVE